MKKNPKNSAAETNQNLTEEEIRLRTEQRKRAARKKRKQLIKTLVVILIIALIAAAVVWRFVTIKRAEKVAESLTTYTVSKRTIEEKLSATGTLQAVDSYTVSASVKGDIIAAPFEEGDEVQEGDVLYVIDSSEMNNTLRQREMSVENAQESYDDLVADRAKLKTTSKYTGTITEVYVEVGDTIREDQVVADIVDKDNMLIDLPFFEVDTQIMRVGEAVKVTISGSGELLDGRITEISALGGVSSTGVKTRDVTISVRNPGGITTATVASAEYSTDITSTDTASFYYNVEEQILAQYGGEIESLNISEGQYVSEGALVLTIDDSDLERSIKNAAQSLETAQMNYDNTIENIADYTITAPITGTVVEKNFNAGESIDVTSGSKTAAVIYDLSALTFSMNIDELDIFSIEKGQQVTVTSEAYSGRTFYGEITKISKIGSTSSGTTVYPVTVTISEPEALASLLPGMNIDAEIIINRVENVLAVPTGAVARGNTVKVIKNPNALKTNTPEGKNGENTDIPENMHAGTQGEMPQRPFGNAGGLGVSASAYGTAPGDTEYETVRVETGVSDDDFIEIVSGLSEGDVVIIEAQQTSGGFFAMMSGFGGMGGMSGDMGGFGGGMGANRGGMGAMPGGR